jgi:hypothetical protein
VLLAAVAFFPFDWYRQSPSGYRELAGQLARPSRMLVSSAGLGEGPWIAVSSLAEPRPSSFIMRASKVLAQSDWNGNRYRLLTSTQDAVSRRLDELAVDTVILHSPASEKPWPHHALLRDMIAVSPAWRPCASAQDLLAYCRTMAPQAPRQPLRLKANGWNFEERIHP